MFKFVIQSSPCLLSVVPVQHITQKYFKWGPIRVTIAVRLKDLESRTFLKSGYAETSSFYFSVFMSQVWLTTLLAQGTVITSMGGGGVGWWCWWYCRLGPMELDWFPPPENVINNLSQVDLARSRSNKMSTSEKAMVAVATASSAYNEKNTFFCIFIIFLFCFPPYFFHCYYLLLSLSLLIGYIACSCSHGIGGNVHFWEYSASWWIQVPAAEPGPQATVPLILLKENHSLQLLLLSYEDQTWGTISPRLLCWGWGDFPVAQPSEWLRGYRAYAAPLCMHRGDDLKVSCYCSRATKRKLTESEEYYHRNISKQSSLWENITGKEKKCSPPHLEIWMKC